MKKIHSIKFGIYYEDTDSSGFTYHTTYLRFAERARTELLKKSFSEILNTMSKNLYFFVVKELSVNFIKPSHLFDELKIDTFFLSNKMTSLMLKHDIFCKKLLICSIIVKLVWIKNDSGKPSRIPSNLISRFKVLEVV